MAHVHALAAEIGPRVVGTEGEQRAREYILAQLSRLGLQATLSPAPCAPLPRLMWSYPLTGLGLILSGWLFPVFPWAMFGAWLTFRLLPWAVRRSAARRPRTALTYNIVAEAVRPGLPQENPAETTLILCTHFDSPLAGGIRHPFWLHLYSVSITFALHVTMAGVALAAWRLLGLPAPWPWLDLLLTVCTTLAGGWLAASSLFDQLARDGQGSPGAHDNASGVGVVLALAEHFAQNPPAHVHLRYLFTSAEETGLHGADAYVRQANLDPAHTRVLNFDMVGAGPVLRYVTGDGTLGARRTDGRLNDLIRAAHPAARPLWYLFRSGDFLPFLQHGILATSLQTSGHPRAGQYYHTVYDTIDIIDVDVLGMVAEVGRRVVDSWEDCQYTGLDPLPRPLSLEGRGESAMVPSPYEGEG